MRYRQKGFTLIELIIAVIIIGILASIIAPVLSGMKARAICTEAVTAMGAIRAAARTYYVEYGVYPTGPLQYDQFGLIGINEDDLNGVYFGKECYSYAANTGGFRIACFPGINSQLGVFTATSSLIMYHTGKITQVDIPQSGYPQDDGTP